MHSNSLRLPEIGFQGIPKYLNRFAELYERQGRSVRFVNNKFWVKYGRIIVPIGPINIDYSISEEQARQLMKMIPGSLMIRRTHGYQEPGGCEDWYAVISDEFKDLASFRSKHRWEIKKGLENCKVKQVDADFIVRYGYDVYLSTFSRYKGEIKPIGKKDFIRIIGTTKDFDDIYHYWAVFYENKVIGYSMMAIFGNEEVLISVGKFVPKYLKLHSHSALIYTLTQHYLSNLSIGCINTGFRGIYHETDVQERNIKKFSFKKKPLKLAITYNYLLQFFLAATYSFRKLLGKPHYKLGSLYMLEEIRRKYESQVPG
jgi:hypothetical protein